MRSDVAADAASVTFPDVVIDVVAETTISSAETIKDAAPSELVKVSVILSIPSPPLIVSEPVGIVKSVVSNVLPASRSPAPLLDRTASSSSSPPRSKTTLVAVPVFAIGSSPAYVISRPSVSIDPDQRSVGLDRNVSTFPLMTSVSKPAAPPSTTPASAPPPSKTNVSSLSAAPFKFSTPAKRGTAYRPGTGARHVPGRVRSRTGDRVGAGAAVERDRDTHRRRASRRR